MFERYTENARRTILWAKHEAHQHGHREIQPEHFLLALLKDAELANGVMKEIAEPEARERIHAHLPNGQQLPGSESVKFFPVYSYLIVYRPNTRPLQIVSILHGRRDVERILRDRS